ncbi:putative GrpE protein HSP-70 cofactor [Candidatus Kuenenia stuttgartiensis]|uniref:Putative GrpE protein HSP-70 cofactor n=1 Tax=Kuenenia stuttgartiensis TaxID=174633 RepID=Q1Q0A4_KUEST|nr:nucleotide exchange factor GrpE [Candidatus Kuenenia stuttgartiensis]QII09866.1 putative GrpE protein HSP-70 cofactor [Candidatus Kuenenia stuttgartiensis]CAJ72756.1 similar to GrpE protein HSP-70 cofactor [Candidatus Kuenenia stuttgartiensis]
MKGIEKPITPEDTENGNPMKQQGEMKHSGEKGTEQTTITEMLASHNTLLKELKSLIETRLSYDETKEKTIEKLHEELKLYRDNFISQSQKPIFIDLIMLYDDFMQVLSVFDEKQDMTKEEIAAMRHNLHTIKEGLLEILYSREVTLYHKHPDFLDYKLHKTIGTVPTSIESENNQVAKIVKPGFCWNGKTLRPEEVIIKKYRKE